MNFPILASIPSIAWNCSKILILNFRLIYERKDYFLTITFESVILLSLNPNRIVFPPDVAPKPSIYIISKCWLDGDHLLFRDCVPYGIIFMNLCVVITVAMVMLLRDFSP
jgi:hypothetical protein